MTLVVNSVEELRGRCLIGCTSVGVAMALLGTLGILLFQAYLWLKSGAWMAIPIATALEFLGIGPQDIFTNSWRGLNVILQWLLELHIGIALIALGLTVGLLIGNVAYLAARLRARLSP